MTWNPLLNSLSWLKLHTSESRTAHEDDDSIDFLPFVNDMSTTITLNIYKPNWFSLKSLVLSDVYHVKGNGINKY